MKKRLLSWLMVLTLCLTLLPATALAAEATPAAQTAGTHAHYLCGGAECDQKGHALEGGMTTFEPWNGIGNVTTGHAYYLTSDIGGFTVPDGVDLTLCLNGHNISASYNGPTIEVKPGATLTLCNCKSGGYITHSNSARGAGVFVGQKDDSMTGTGKNSAVFHMYGGIIGGNSDGATKTREYIYGSGVVVMGGTFYMYGGTITQNRVDDSYGGGVSVYNNGTFTMSGGTIRDNTAKYGGGVSVGIAVGINHGENKIGGTFTMSGGEITLNTGTYNAGGVYVGSGSDTHFTVSGAAQIKDNYQGMSYPNGTANNVYLPKGNEKYSVIDAIIKVGTLDSTAKIGVTTEEVGQTVATDVSAAAEKYFFSDNSKTYRLKYDSSESTLTMIAAAHSAHPICGDASCKDSSHALPKGSSWQGVSGLSSITSQGYYYLTKDVEINGTWQAPNGVNLCLNGYRIIETGDVDAIKVNGNTFTLCDCVGTGEITHAEGKTGSGVYVINGTFIMHGGSITGNRNTKDDYGHGGGVSMEGGSFTMTGGSITKNSVKGNSESYGGGVCVGYGSQFTMTGGSITENTTGSYGGGVYVDSSSTAFTVSGEVNITGNTHGNIANNVELYPLTGGNLPTITIGEGGLDASAKIGVTAKNVGTGEYVTVATGASNGYTEGTIFSDKAEPYATRQEGNEVRLYNGLPHEHAICGDKKCSEGHDKVTYRPLTESQLTKAGKDSSITSINSYYDLAAGNWYLKDDLMLNDGVLRIQGEVKLCLNGHTIQNSISGHAIFINGENASLTLCDCSTAQSGTITTKFKGRGVTIWNGSFTMYGGSIAGNGAADSSRDGYGGAGVYVPNGTTFTMYGGAITGNKSNTSYGGGVYVYGGSTFNMYGGSITGNSAKSSNGGGVYMYNSTVNIYGGSITCNSAKLGGGVYVDSAGKLTLQGAPSITDNTDSAASNVYLKNGRTITLKSALTAGAAIGVTTEKSITDGSYAVVAAGDTVTLSDTDLSAFTSDAGYDKRLNGNKIFFTKGNLHEHAICGAVCEDGKQHASELWQPLTYDAATMTLYCGGEAVKSDDYRILAGTDENNNEKYIYYMKYSLPAGNYYLADDIALNGGTANGETYVGGLIRTKGYDLNVNLCLNGFTLSATNPNTHLLYASMTQTLTLSDCKGGGTIRTDAGGYNVLYVSGDKDRSATFTMYGGTISGARTGVCGYNKNVINLFGGTITGNECGVEIGANGTVTVGGTVNITGNTEKNLNLYTGGKTGPIFSIDSTLTQASRIGISSPLTESGQSPIQIATGAVNDALKYTEIFTADAKSDGYVVVKEGTELFLKKHQHSWTYALKSGTTDTITATCTAPGCPLTSGNGGSVTISAPAANTLTYDGQGKPATVTASADWQGPAANTIKVSYTYGSGNPPTQLEGDAVPTNARTYTAEIAVGTGDNKATASVTYEINKATPQASDFTFTPPTNLNYDGTPKYPTFTPGIGGVIVYPMYYDAGGNKVSPINVGTYTVKIKVEVSSNDNYNSVDELTSGDWTFTILQADYTGQKSDKTINIVKGRSAAQTGTLTAADFFPEGTELPADAEIASVTPASGTMMASVTVNDGTLTYTSNTNIAATENESYTVTISTTNYKNFEVTLTFHPADKQPQTNFGFKDVVGGKVTKTYGDDVFKLEATGQVDGSKVTYSSNDDTVADVDENTGMVAIKGVGTVKITAKALATEEYAEATAEYTLTVSPKTLTANDLEFTTDTITKTYDGDTTCTTATVQIKSAAKVNQNDVLPTVTGTYAYNSKDVNSASKVTFTSTESSSTNYILPANLTVEHAASITKCVLTVGEVDTISKTYNTYKNALDCVTGIELIGTVSGETLRFYTSAETGGDYGITGTNFDSADAGQNKTITGTVVLLSKSALASNYTFKVDGKETDEVPFEATATIEPADSWELTPVNDLTIRYNNRNLQTYTPNWSALLPSGQTWTYSASAATTGNAALDTNTIGADTGVLGYQLSAGNAGDTVTWTITASCANYQSFTLPVTLTLIARDQQTNFKFADNTTSVTKTYGDEDFTIKATDAATGSNVSYESTNTNVATVDNTGKVTIVGAGQTTIKAKASVTADFEEKEISYTLTVNKATVTVKAKDKSAYVGDVAPELPTAPVKDTDYTVTGLIGEDTLSGIVTLAYGNTPDMNKVGEETITISGTLANANYEITYVNGKLSITNRPSSGGGSYTPTYPVSTPSKTENGSVSSNVKNASKGDTVTITVKPDSGYVLDDLTVTDKNGNELKLNDKGNGKYTFTMPAGKVEVKASFAEAVETSPFADVETNAYYYEAVKWAADKGITGGIGNSLFGPNQPCTRAQIVTFLWRAAGSPEPKGTAAGMTDVVSGSYYEKAVAWAIENGVTTGTTASTFSPNATCTRAQAVTFLARALSAKATSAAEFSDVPANSYFAEAVAWAAANSVTEGVGNGLFAPHNNCTRAQIVTFLYRAYNK